METNRSYIYCVYLDFNVEALLSKTKYYHEKLQCCRYLKKNRVKMKLETEVTAKVTFGMLLVGFCLRKQHEICERIQVLQK